MHKASHAAALIPAPRTTPEERAEERIVSLNVVEIRDPERVAGEVLKPQVTLFILATCHDKIFVSQRGGHRVDVVFKFFTARPSDNHTHGLIHKEGSAGLVDFSQKLRVCCFRINHIFRRLFR